MSWILETLHEIEGKRIPHYLTIGEFEKKVNLVFCVAVGLGDGKNGDSISGHYLSHHSKLKRHMRQCDCTFEHLANPFHRCLFMEAEPIKRLVLNSLEDGVIGNGSSSKDQKAIEAFIKEEEG
jgi:hypothetical protein